MRKPFETDQNIIKSLLKLKVPMKNALNRDIFFDERKRGESTFEHIGNKKHQLKVRDIELIPEILLNKSSYRKDSKSSKFNIYIGKRKVKDKRRPYLKIITRIKNDNSEKIITIYPIRRIND